MALRHVAVSPEASDFTPLHEHEEQTPTTFFGSKSVLYAVYSNVTLAIPTDKLQTDPVIAKFTATPDADTPNSLVRDVDIWVSSSYAYHCPHDVHTRANPLLPPATSSSSRPSPARPASQSRTPPSRSMRQ